ncbi:ATP-binding protein [Streptomyces sp. NPDC052396]|uniref:ATP-binding protein n=1 Tax=Streptomyces sp. NPDC052396 TaxID=3365689 RepID=UPI0037D53F9A
MGTEGSTVLSPVWRGLPGSDASAVSDSAFCALPPRFEAVRTARSFTRTTLQQWGVQHLFDDVSLVVSELVTNSMRYALPSGPLDEGHESPIRLHLMRWSSRLVCAVRDPSEDSPATGAAGADDERGRGLMLVESFSDAWGWHPLAGALHGKVVWALFRLPRE